MDRATLELAPADAGCELTLIHEVSPEWADQSEEGWNMILDTLDHVLG